MTSLQAHLSRWQLQPDGLAFETHTSRLLPVIWRGKQAMLKVFKGHSDEKDSGDILRLFNGVGMVRVLAGDHDSLVLERAGPATCLDVEGQQGDVIAMTIVLDVVHQLHSVRVLNAASAVPLRLWFSVLFEHEGDSDLHRRCAAMARALLDAPQEEVILHGDIHHGNILESPRGWLAIDPKGLKGERAYDIANLFGNLLAKPDVFLDRARMIWLARECAVRLGLDVTRVLQFAFAFAGLAASWPGEVDDPEPRLRLRSAEILEDILRGVAI